MRTAIQHTALDRVAAPAIQHTALDRAGRPGSCHPCGAGHMGLGQMLKLELDQNSPARNATQYFWMKEPYLNSTLLLCCVEPRFSGPAPLAISVKFYLCMWGFLSPADIEDCAESLWSCATGLQIFEIEIETLESLWFSMYPICNEQTFGMTSNQKLVHQR